VAVRALIIAIQNYPDAEGMATSLQGTLQAGLDFQNWLLAKLNAEGRTADAQILLCSEPQQPGRNGARRADILGSLNLLKLTGRGTTEELFVFFSGHGFAFVEKPGSRADVIITSDYRNNIISGDCCLNLDQIVTWLRDHLGPGRHYYFIDACRNKLNGNQVTVGSLLPTDLNAMPDASSFVLQSTVEGAVATVGDAFPKTLLEGLRGRGKAKTWDPNVEDAMFVRYDSLRRFLRDMLELKQPITSKVSGELGESDAVFAKIKPVDNVRCTIEIEGRQASDQVIVIVRRGRAVPEPPLPLGDALPTLELQPDSYTFSVSIKDASVVPSSTTVELYEDQTLRFQKLAAGVGTGGPESIRGDPIPPPQGGRRGFSDLEVIVPPNTSFSLRNIDTGYEHAGDQTQIVSLPLGSYSAKMRDADNRLLLDTTFEISAGKSVPLKPSIPRMSITSRLPGGNDGLDFSETLGGLVADTDLNLWLALLGGGRILGPHGDYSKIAKFPLHNFSNEPAGASPVYVLAGFEDPDTKLQVSISDGAIGHWQEAAQPGEMPGIREAYSAAQGGPKLISVRLTGDIAYTVASLASPNRGTLITLTLDEDGEFCVSQYVLPLGHLTNQFPEQVRESLKWRNHLNDVRFLAQASRAFRKRRNVLKEYLSGRELDDLLYAKWLDPIAASLASYELLRRGQTGPLPEVVGNMRRYFPDFPDTSALARLTGEHALRPAGPPLFSDGLRAFPDYAEWLPLPASHLDFTSPWTAWRAAVS
jgi:hypothetical protein